MLEFYLPFNFFLNLSTILHNLVKRYGNKNCTVHHKKAGQPFTQILLSKHIFEWPLTRKEIGRKLEMKYTCI